MHYRQPRFHRLVQTERVHNLAGSWLECRSNQVNMLLNSRNVMRNRGNADGLVVLLAR